MAASSEEMFELVPDTSAASGGKAHCQVQRWFSLTCSYTVSVGACAAEAETALRCDLCLCRVTLGLPELKGNKDRRA